MSLIPVDIQTIYAFLGQMLVELTDLMAEEVREWRAELVATVKDWKSGGSEADCQTFRDSMNDICHIDGMPVLFPTEKEK